MAESLNAEYAVNSLNGLVINMDSNENIELVKHCSTLAAVIVNPIIDWTDSDVWEFLKHYSCEANPLYQCGRKRIGCIGCPMQSNRKRIEEFERYPKYKNLYIRAFDKMLEAHPDKKLKYRSENGIDVFDWWTGFDSNQLMFDI